VHQVGFHYTDLIRNLPSVGNTILRYVIFLSVRKSGMFVLL